MLKHICHRASALLTTALFFLAVWTVVLMALPQASQGQVTIVQLSDTHIGLSTAPQATPNLRQAVQMINAMHPDAVVVTGDIGENVADWNLARSILSGIKVPLFYAPGNHDVHTHNVNQYRSVFGADYFRFDVRGITFLVIDSQLLGNFDNYNATTPPPLPADTQAESNKMMAWLSGQAASIPKGAVVIGIQHIPVFRNGSFPNDSRPYWIISEPFRSREMAALEKIGVKHMLVGHWHHFMVFSSGGITWHEGASTSWLPQGGQLGFAVHTISSSGNVSSQFVLLPGAKP
ncbi:MAG TPA: metallophosphoesterase [Candidatus Angelobacter sp.]